MGEGKQSEAFFSFVFVCNDTTLCFYFLFFLSDFNTLNCFLSSIENF